MPVQATARPSFRAGGSQDVAGPGGAVRAEISDRMASTSSASLLPSVARSISLAVMRSKLKPLPASLTKNFGGVIDAVAIR